MDPIGAALAEPVCCRSVLPSLSALPERLTPRCNHVAALWACPFGGLARCHVVPASGLSPVRIMVARKPPCLPVLLPERSGRQLALRVLRLRRPRSGRGSLLTGDHCSVRTSTVCVTSGRLWGHASGCEVPWMARAVTFDRSNLLCGLSGLIRVNWVVHVILWGMKKDASCCRDTLGKLGMCPVDLGVFGRVWLTRHCSV